MRRRSIPTWLLFVSAAVAVVLVIPALWILVSLTAPALYPAPESVPPSDLTRFGMAIQRGALLQPKTVATLQNPQRLASGEETGSGLGWELETVTLAGKSTREIGHRGDSLGGNVASLLTFPDYRMVVAVTSNASHADTFSLGTKIAEAFAEQGPSPARN